MRRLRTAILILIGAALTGAAVQARQTVGSTAAGRVVDAETEAPLAGAHVFLEGSTFGAVTDADGRFRLAGLPRGAYTLIISMVGYEPASQALRIAGPQSEALQIGLTPRVLALDQVEVVGERPEVWQEQLARFTRNFLGESIRAGKTTVLNPEVLYFEEDGDRLRARSDGPLVIENQALGYRMTYVLDEYVEADDLVRYRGRVGFEALEPRNRRERRRWRRSRDEVYEGSLRHLLRALATGEQANHFKLYLVPAPEPFEFMDLDGRETIPGQPVDASAIVVPQGDTYLLRFDRYLCVVYLGETIRMQSTYPGARPAEQLLERQISWITLDPSTRAGAEFDANGRLHDPYAVHAYGVIGDRRMAELLPWDYKP